MSLTNNQILHQEGINFVKENSYDKAIECYNKIIKEHPHNIDTYYNELGDIYEKKNMFYEAIMKCYINIIANDKENSYILNKIAICYFKLNQFKLALHYFKKVLTQYH
jgi:tetratricopeptide (TPR) repeat protein